MFFYFVFKQNEKRIIKIIGEGLFISYLLLSGTNRDVIKFVTKL